MALFLNNLLLVIALSLASGCAKYTPTRLHKHLKTERTYTQQQHNVELTLQAFGSYEFKDQCEPFQFVHLKLKNKTTNNYLLSGTNISLPLATPEMVNQKAPALYLKYMIPSTICTLLGIIFLWEIILPVAIPLALWGYQKSNLQNIHNLADLKQHMLWATSSVAIGPYQEQHFLIAIRKEQYLPEFTIRLENTASHKPLDFNAMLIERQCITYTTYEV